MTTLPPIRKISTNTPNNEVFHNTFAKNESNLSKLVPVGRLGAAICSNDLIIFPFRISRISTISTGPKREQRERKEANGKIAEIVKRRFPTPDRLSFFIAYPPVDFRALSRLKFSQNIFRSLIPRRVKVSTCLRGVDLEICVFKIRPHSTFGGGIPQSTFHYFMKAFNSVGFFFGEN